MKSILTALFVLTQLFTYAQQAGDTDVTFGTSGIVNITSLGSANAVAIQGNDKIIVTAGSFGVGRFMPNGSIDTTFGSNGMTIIPIGSNDLVTDVIVQPDGKIVMVGYSDNGTNLKDFAVVRLNSNGTLDTTFSDDGILQIAFGNLEEQAKAVVLQSDGKIIVAGFATIATNKDIAIARVNADGTLDTTFSVDGKLTIDVLGGNDVGNGVALQTNGAIVVVSTSFPASTPTVSSYAAIRLTPEGILDTTFNSTGKVSTKVGTGSDNAEALAIQTDGKIVLGGNSYMSTILKEDFSVVRYTTTGILDTTFSGDGKLSINMAGSDYGNCLKLQYDDKILIGGALMQGTIPYFGLARIYAAGLLDNSFSGDGKITTFVNGYSGSDLGIQSSGRFVQVGYTNSGLYMTRFYGIPNCSNNPSGLNAFNLTASSASIGWTSPANPPQSYDYFYSTNATAPVSADQAVGNVLATSGVTASLNGLDSNTLYYYWIRSNCGSDSKGTWIAGGSFTTTAIMGCTTGTLQPLLTYQPLCNGSFETILSDASSGTYSTIATSSNKSYTFSSNVTSDFITITNFSGNVIYAYGITPISWNSGNTAETIRYYIHANAFCGTDTYTRIKALKCVNYSCANPASLNANAITATTATLNWVVASTPALGYEYIISTINNAPIVTSSPSGTSINLTTLLSGLMPETTYYFWVRSKCSSQFQNNWISGGSFSTTAFMGCNTGLIDTGLAFTLACNGSYESVGTLGIGSYDKLNVNSNKTYIFNSNYQSDFITITNNVNNTILAYGVTPFSWNSASFSGTVRYYLHTNSSCGTTGPSRLMTIKCGTTLCSEPVTLSSTAITNTSVQLNWNVTTTPLIGFQYYISTNNTIPNYNTNPSGNTNNLYGIVNGLTPATTYYFWVRSICDVNTISNWIPGNNFSTLSLSGCTSGILWPTSTYTPLCSGNMESINTDAVAGQYSTINIVANSIYTFNSSISTDYATITDATGMTVLAQGTVPLVWNASSNSGIIRFYIHSSFACNVDSTLRTRFISCATPCIPPTNFLITNITTTSAALSWTANTNATGYEIYYNSTNTIPIANAIPTTTGITGTTAVLSGLTNNTIYYCWIRTSCNALSSSSSWTYIGSFETGYACYLGVLKPESYFTPNCTGENEIINTDALAGEYSNVNIIGNKKYTFTSSNPTDYIRLYINSNGYPNEIASGNSPLIWLSNSNSGVIQYHIFTNYSCGVENVSRTRYIKCSIPSCNAPSAIFYSNITTSSVTVNWTNPSQNTQLSFDYYFSLTNTPPTSITTPTGNFTTISGNTGLTPPNVLPGTIYYLWLRSNCEINTKSDWVAGGSFATLSTVGCINGNVFPAFSVFTPSCSGSPEIIVTNAYAGEYSKVNIQSNSQYTFSSSVTTDYITIANESGSVTYAYGPSPLVWDTGLKSGVIRYYLHSSSSCGSANVNRTRYISCGNSVICDTANIQNVSAINVINITRTTANVTFTASGSSINYMYYINSTNIPPTVTTAPSGVATAGTLGFNLIGLTFGTTYYIWLRSDCGSLSNWFYGGSFTTISGCIDGTMYPTTVFTPTCTGTAQTITTSAYAGEYSKINIISNNQYTFSSSVFTDYVTITNEAGTIIYADGVSPLIWNSSTATGIIRYYLHTNNTLCGVQNTNRIRYITCGASNCNVVAPIASNQSFCNYATVASLVATGSNLRWYTVATGGTELISSTVLSTGIYYVSQTITNCESDTRTVVQVTITSNVTPTFTAVNPICSGASLSALPTTSNNTITGAWSPALNNTTTTTYTFTPTTGQCATNTTMQIVVTPNVTPTFTAVNPICTGASLPVLPTTSNNIITGVWSPALNNTATTTYTFTPTTGQCATSTTMQIVVTPNVTPTFTAVNPICSGTSFSALPTTSNNTITGAWSPAMNNTATTTYTFTPTTGQCANSTTMQIVVNPIVSPTFTAVNPICSGAALPALPTTSNNSITGAWSPALNNTATTTYTFTPTTGQCATSTTMQIAVTPNVTPTFTPISPICVGATLLALPTASNNTIMGAWSPALNNTATTIYTFTPTTGQCANSTTMQIVVNPIVSPTFTAVNPICSGAALPALPTTSNNSITGAWSPAMNNTATTTYTFTPTTGQCATNKTMQIVVTPNVTPIFTAINPICSGASLPALPTTSNNTISGAWSPALNNTATTTYTFTPTTGQCATSNTMQIVVNSTPVVTTLSSVTVCGNYVLPVISNGNYYSGINGTGTLIASGTLITQSTHLYIFAQNTSCTAQSDFVITIIVLDTSTTLSNATITANQSNALYQWLDCDNSNAIIPNATNQSFIAVSNGHYAVQLTLGTCSETSSCVTINTLGTENFEVANDISIYPNPSKGNFTIDTGNYIADSIQVLDDLGRIILSVKPNLEKIGIDVSDFSDGIYFVKINKGGMLYTKKLLLRK